MSCYSGNCWEVKRYKDHEDFFQLQLQVKAKNIKQARIITDFVIDSFLGVLSVETNCCIYSRKSAKFQLEKLFIEENAAFKDSNEYFMDGYSVDDKGILTISKKCIKVLDKILEEAEKLKFDTNKSILKKYLDAVSVVQSANQITELFLNNGKNINVESSKETTNSLNFYSNFNFTSNEVSTALTLYMTSIETLSLLEAKPADEACNECGIVSHHIGTNIKEFINLLLPDSPLKKYTLNYIQLDRNLFMNPLIMVIIKFSYHNYVQKILFIVQCT